MKSLVILGAADGSVPTYRTARRLGFRTIGFDQRSDVAAVPLADEFLQISTRDQETIAAALDGRDDIAGVLAPASDAALPTLRWLTSRWGLPSINDDVVRASLDKSYFRALCERIGLSSYRHVEGSSVDQLSAAAVELGLPVFVKPVDGTGSRGISFCAEPAHLPAAITAAMRASYAGRVIIEEGVAGDPYTLEGFVEKGSLGFVAVARRTITPPPHPVTTSYLLPAGPDQRVRDQMVAMVDALCRELRYDRGPVDVDFVISEDGRIHLIEFGARIGGSGLIEAVRRACGVDVVASSIQAAVDLPVDLSPIQPRRCAMVRMLCADRAGVLTAITGVAETRAMPEVDELLLLAREGGRVAPYLQAANKLGYVLLVGDTPQQLITAADRVGRTLRFTVTDTFGGNP